MGVIFIFSEYDRQNKAGARGLIGLDTIWPDPAENTLFRTIWGKGGGNTVVDTYSRSFRTIGEPKNYRSDISASKIYWSSRSC